jgi:hypothetical protein
MIRESTCYQCWEPLVRAECDICFRREYVHGTLIPKLLHFRGKGWVTLPPESGETPTKWACPACLEVDQIA